jgi:hypothetical protein
MRIRMLQTVYLPAGESMTVSPKVGRALIAAKQAEEDKADNPVTEVKDGSGTAHGAGSGRRESR